MTIIRWQQRPALANLMDNFFDRDFMTGFERNCGCVPATNILERPDQYELQIAAPGMKKDDFQIEVENNMLTISYEKKADEATREEENFIRREYNLEGFTRTFTVPKHADAENISGRYDNGMLYVSIPRLDPHKNKLTKKIEIA